MEGKLFDLCFLGLKQKEDLPLILLLGRCSRSSSDTAEKKTIQTGVFFGVL
jgi:hypothetical protein